MRWLSLEGFLERRVCAGVQTCRFREWVGTLFDLGWHLGEEEAIWGGIRRMGGCSVVSSAFLSSLRC